MLNEEHTTQLSQFLQSTAKYLLLCKAKIQHQKNADCTLKNKLKQYKL